MIVTSLLPSVTQHALPTATPQWFKPSLSTQWEQCSWSELYILHQTWNLQLFYSDKKGRVGMLQVWCLRQQQLGFFCQWDHWQTGGTCFYSVTYNRSHRTSGHQRLWNGHRFSLSTMTIHNGNRKNCSRGGVGVCSAPSDVLVLALRSLAIGKEVIGLMLHACKVATPPSCKGTSTNYN
jgi:hypothetical protein